MRHQGGKRVGHPSARLGAPPMGGVTGRRLAHRAMLCRPRHPGKHAHRSGAQRPRPPRYCSPGTMATPSIPLPAPPGPTCFPTAPTHSHPTLTCPSQGLSQHGTSIPVTAHICHPSTHVHRVKGQGAPALAVPGRSQVPWDLLPLHRWGPCSPSQGWGQLQRSGGVGET